MASAISIYKTCEEKLEYAFFEQPKGKVQETIDKICAFFEIKSEWDKELISRICFDRKFNHFELVKGTSKYVVDISKTPDLVAQDPRANLLRRVKQLVPSSSEIFESEASKTEMALSRSNFSALLQKSPTGLTVVTERLISKL